MKFTLQHVSIPRPPGSEETARAFYGGLLGMEEKPVPTTIAHHNLIWFRAGDELELHLFTEDPISDPSARHFCMVVDDLEELRRRLVEAGYTPWEPDIVRGRPRFFCRDPFNNMIEFTTIVDDYLKYQDAT